MTEENMSILMMLGVSFMLGLLVGVRSAQRGWLE